MFFNSGNGDDTSSSCFKDDLLVDHGEVTAYTDKAINGNCGFTAMPSNMAEKYFVAINQPSWKDGAYCGACVKIRVMTKNNEERVISYSQITYKYI